MRCYICQCSRSTSNVWSVFKLSSERSGRQTHIAILLRLKLNLIKQNPRHAYYEVIYHVESDLVEELHAVKMMMLVRLF